MNPDCMREAIRCAHEGIHHGQTPFGACIECNGRIVASAHNLVFAGTDSTAHAEIVAIREAQEKLGRIDLSNCTMYATTEPCPMCFAACHWARISRIIYGTSIEDVRVLGFSEMTLSNISMQKLGGSRMEIVGGYLLEENQALLREWEEMPDRKVY
ncbi:deaminase [Methanocalculus chunghsingensis]|uniref:Deaminase n=1 Tax=Methanocalculus chunghsingensis TaxID=156457 RepID=A0A8J7W4U5_9EURY|nr:nucleoside deaminase [Methanocalculus chunghsingensis]MBR1368309.1 deaminase [Methanocalculus chunghsingensis]